MESRHPHQDEVKHRIFETIAFEQEQLARILKSLADKVETTSRWLPHTAPEEPFNQIVEKVKGLEGVIAQEIEATADKEKAIRMILEQFEHHPDGHHCKGRPCPCHLFEVCKVAGHCVASASG